MNIRVESRSRFNGQKRRHKKYLQDFNGVNTPPPFTTNLPMDIQFQLYQDRFHNYVKPFLTSNHGETTHIQLKIDHTLRVYQNACTITKEHLECETTIMAARLAALFHDIGRFEQYEKYRTFSDVKSLNHAHLGVKVLNREGLLQDLPRNLRKLVLAAVGLHNKSDLPERISPLLQTICHIVRDSDKIDIFSVMLDSFTDDNKVDSTIALDAKPHPTKYTRLMYENVLHNRPCLYTEIEWVNDFKLLLANWSYCLNFPASYKMFYESGNFDRIFDQLPDLEEFTHLKKQLQIVVYKKMLANNI